MTMSQTQMILNHLQKNKGITSMEAISEYGITRLASRIHELRESGHNIQNFWEESVNRYGVKVKYVRYVLIKKEKKDLLPDETGWKKTLFGKWLKK
jgi:hypothetical protein